MAAITMTKSAMVSAMQHQRTTATRPSTRLVRRLTRRTALLPSERGPAAPRAVVRSTGAARETSVRPLARENCRDRRSEALLGIEDERDRLLDAEALGLLADERRHRLHERRLVDIDDLGEVALELLEILDLGHLPRSPHVGLGPRSRLDQRHLLLVVELIVQLHGDEQEIGYAHVLVEGVVFRDLVEFLGDDG